LKELSPRIKRELLRLKLRDDFSQFVRAVFTHLHPGETYLHNWHIDLLCDILAAGRRRGKRRAKRLRKIIRFPGRIVRVRGDHQEPQNAEIGLVPHI
jgi:hypothetical protein